MNIIWEVGCSWIGEFLEVIYLILRLNYGFVAVVLVEKEVDVLRIGNDAFTHIGSEHLY